MKVVVTLCRFFASLAYIGYIPRSPGTSASLATTLLLFFLPPVDTHISLVCIFILFFLGVAASSYLEREGRVHDPSWIVIDEVVGMWIALLSVPRTAPWFLAALILFRFFDISKCCGISYFERLARGWGVMLDDVVSGLYSLIILQTIIFLFR